MNCTHCKHTDAVENENGIFILTIPKNIENPNPVPDSADESVVWELKKSVTSYTSWEGEECCPIPKDTKKVLV